MAKRKRAFGTGTVQQVGNRWLALTPGQPRIRVGTYDTEPEATEALDAWLAAGPHEPADEPEPEPDTLSPHARSKLVGRYLNGVRAHAPVRGKRRDVALGALPGYPSMTTDADTVERAADELAARLRTNPPKQAVAELRARQRVLTLRSEAKRLRALGNHSAERADFVRLGKQWATDNGIGYEALRDFGVPADVLKAAGISPSGK